MGKILEKRLSLHRQLTGRQEGFDLLKRQLDCIQPLANIGLVTCMVAHEINNMLTPIGTYAELALNHPDDRELARTALEKTMRNSQRAAKVLESMLAMANGQDLEKKQSRLGLLVEQIFDCICRDFKKDKITVDIQIPDDLTVYGAAVQIQQVLMNLILNARDAMAGKAGTLTIKARQDDDSVCIEVSDTGCGIKHQDMPRLFEPFFTTKKPGESETGNSGAGLGLALCKEIIDSHNGTISVKSEVNNLTTFKVILPNS